MKKIAATSTLFLFSASVFAQGSESPLTPSEWLWWWGVPSLSLLLLLSVLYWRAMRRMK